MVLDYRDKELLMLAGRYRWLPYQSLGKYGFDGLNAETDILIRLGLLKLARGKEYVWLSDDGYKLLTESGICFSRGGRRGYAGSPTLLRRLQTVDIMLTCLRAGIDTLRDDVQALREQPVFYPAFDLRPAMMNCANCSGFGHWGGTAYMIQYLSSDSPGMYCVSEFTTFHKLSSLFADNTSGDMALLLAVESYSAMLNLLAATGAPSSRHGKNGFVDFRELYGSLDTPLYLVPCNETGARQLAVMCRPDYRARIAKSVYGQRWQESDDKIPDADGCVDGAPLVIAVDMDLRRVESVVNAAKTLNRNMVRVAAFEEQIREVLYPMYPRDREDNIVQLLKIDGAVLDAAFGGFTLYDMDRSPAYSAKGGTVHA